MGVKGVLRVRPVVSEGVEVRWVSNVWSICDARLAFWEMR